MTNDYEFQFTDEAHATSSQSTVEEGTKDLREDNQRTQPRIFKKETLYSIRQPPAFNFFSIPEVGFGIDFQKVGTALNGCSFGVGKSYRNARKMRKFRKNCIEPSRIALLNTIFTEFLLLLPSFIILNKSFKKMLSIPAVNSKYTKSVINSSQVNLQKTVGKCVPMAQGLPDCHNRDSKQDLSSRRMTRKKIETISPGYRLI